MKSGSSIEDVICFKVCLVAKGYYLKEWLDYNEISSLVVGHTSMRILLALVETLDMELEQFNVQTTFLKED